MTPTIIFLLSAILAVLFAALARLIAKRTRRFGVPVSTLGGPALLAALFFVFPFAALPQGLAVGALGMALIGFVDDWRPFPPLHKFALTLAVAGIATGLGHRIHLAEVVWIDGALTVLWMVWMCHAFNVLDMADGLSAGIGVIASLTLYLMGAGPWALVATGALVGYLAHNIHPARIYMGDAGSLLFGFLLSSMGIAVVNQAGGISGVVAPFIALGVPTFEALFISAMRFAKGRSIARASRDHVAQRLVQCGLSVRVAVALMWLAGLVACALGIVVALGHWLGLIGALCLASVAWLGLSRVDMEGD